MVSGISRFVTEDDTDLDLAIGQLKNSSNQVCNPMFGDGFAADKIVSFILNQQLG
jgi:hypothetical protein